ncbi:hypothetical protein Agub_g7656 [Astrephomene gubernaculifera]|uniref:Protein phosphatase inhibitor 2 n=1 Tax=Astrephomene gubernaculifera TaxID=47775 RepID=A0AAD3HMG5_9CHLO|nr:hypothetical protein Agub_g7656 [Astrephomene gubernaculifera]
MRKSGSARKRPASGVRWDEQNLQDNEVIKATISKTKINEPKTPYHGPLGEEHMQEVDAGLLPLELDGCDSGHPSDARQHSQQEQGQRLYDMDNGNGQLPQQVLPVMTAAKVHHVTTPAGDTVPTSLEQSAQGASESHSVAGTAVASGADAAVPTAPVSAMEVDGEEEDDREGAAGPIGHVPTSHGALSSSVSAPRLPPQHRDPSPALLLDSSGSSHQQHPHSGLHAHFQEGSYSPSHQPAATAVVEGTAARTAAAGPAVAPQPLEVPDVVRSGFSSDSEPRASWTGGSDGEGVDEEAHRQFEKRRRAHYNMRAALQQARLLLSSEDGEDEGEEDVEEQEQQCAPSGEQGQEQVESGSGEVGHGRDVDLPDVMAGNDRGCIGCASGGSGGGIAAGDVSGGPGNAAGSAPEGNGSDWGSVMAE